MFIGSCGPVPYPNELLYSYQARLRIEFAIKSPKALTENLYDSRAVSASWIYPSQLKKLVEFIPANAGLSASKLIQYHTLFPQAAPFIPHKRRLQIEEQMFSGNASSIHALSGYSASKLPKLQHPRYCPMCVNEQISQYGEPFWLRLHQISAIRFCHVHNIQLCSVSEVTRGQYRHEFVAASSCDLSGQAAAQYCKYNKVLSIACDTLLNTENLPSPSYAQWTNHYRQLARSHGYLKGAFINFGPIQLRIVSHWPTAILSHNNLALSDEQTSWLHSIFRKHRKTFSYLQHILVNAAFSETEFDIAECIHSANRQRKSLRKYDSVLLRTKTDESEVEDYRAQWICLLCNFSPKVAREQQPSLYTKLYRLDKEWLVAVNERHRAKREKPSERVNWHYRDRVIVRSMFRTLYMLDDDLALPRMTKRWLMYQQVNPSTIEKYILKLPLTRAFLDRYSETVTEYQVRRITHQLLNNRHPHITRRWFLLRAAGLSEERMTEVTKRFVIDLGDMLSPFGVFSVGSM
jgi:hypothetical protein